MMGERREIGDERIEAWLEALASEHATPGGGAWAALSAAAGAGLVAMVGRLTIGKPAYADAEARMREIVGECDRERAELLAMADRDAEAFDAVMAAYRMPRGTEPEQQARMRALQTALEGAVEIPLLVARRAVYAMSLAEEATSIGNPNAASDGLSGAAALHAAAVAALANVRINAFAYVDPTNKDELLADCARLRERANALLADVEEAFTARVS